MKYNNIREAIFVDRPNRFVANVEIDGVIEAVHVKNTGRCLELLIPGVKVTLEQASNPNRKTKYDLISVYTEDRGWINMDSQAPNVIMREWLASNNGIFPDIAYLQPEFTFGDSRIDYYLEDENRKVLIEVKGCTLSRSFMGYFPDAPTERGVKHLNELTEAVYDGYEAYIAFVIQMNNIDMVQPNRELDPEFAEAVLNAVRHGVKFLFIACEVTPDTLEAKSHMLISHPYLLTNPPAHQ